MIAKTIEYLKEFRDPEGKRRRLRLPVKLPVLYGFPSGAGCDFRQAMSLDISSSGVQIEVLDPPPEVAEPLGRKDGMVSMKFDMPERKDLLETVGKICWTHQIKTPDHARVRVGVEFLPISLNGQIELMSHAVGIAKRKMWARIGLTTGAILLVLSTVAGAAVYVNRNLISQDRNASQRILQKMEYKIQELAREKAELEQQMEQLRQKSGR